MRACSIASAVFLLVACALALAAASSGEWYRIRVDYVTESGRHHSVRRYGLLQQCLEADAKRQIWTENYGEGPCGRSGRHMDTRMHATLWLLIASAIVAFIGTISSALAFRLNSSRWFSRISLLCSGLAASTAVTGTVVFYVSIEHWYFCDKSYCNYRGRVGTMDACANSLSGSFYAGISAVVCAVLASVCQLIAIVCALKKGVSPTEPELREVTRDDQQNLQCADERVRPPPPPSAGDWVYDAGSGLYLSDQQHVYLDVVTSKCHDPKSGQWHDPVGVAVSE
jgi:hypothetical protein